VAEDEPHIRRILLALLESAAFDADVATDGLQALDRLSSPVAYDLILTDLRMPHLTGLELLERIRTMEHRRGTPVIMLTAKALDADRRAPVALGAREFMTKPFSPKKLLARIHELLDE
jgi:CheY-like chemotaxis protein